MNKHCSRLVATAALLLAAAGPSLAADGKTTVKVALLDMSSIMPAAATGYGMMGMMGPGMMGPAWNQGQWNQGQRPAYPGMMGPGMMGGVMSIRTDQGTVKAGSVSFEVTNWSRSVLHEMLVVAVDSPTTALPYDYTALKIPEEQVKVLGEASDLQPNITKTVDLTLTPGSYLLICNVPGHYASGMVAAITVTP